MPSVLPGSHSRLPCLPRCTTASAPNPSVQPVVRGQIVMARRQVGVVVDRDGVLPETPRRLHHQDDVVRLHCGDDDLAVGIVAAVDEQLTRRRAPMLLDGLGELGGQRREPVAVVLGRQSNRIARQLFLGEPVRVLAAAFDQRVDQGVAVLRVDAGNVADPIAGVAHGAQQRDRTGRGVQPDGVADPGVFGRVCREHHRDALVLRRDGAQPRVAHREARHPGTALRIGDVGDQALVVNLLERERDGDDAPVELRHRDLGGDVERADAVVVVVPLRPRAGQAQALQYRNVQRGKVCHVPGVVAAARGHGGGNRAARGQHGGHHRVGRFRAARACRARRCAATRSTPVVRARPPLRLRRTAPRRKPVLPASCCAR